MQRFSIDHIRLTHPFIFKQEEQPQCIARQTTYTIKHFLLECRDLTLIKQCFFNSNNTKDLFENVNIDDILSFLREIKLYLKLWI